MFSIEYDSEKNIHVLVASSGERIEMQDDVWEKLQDADMLFDDFRKTLQMWSIHVEKADLLKAECSSMSNYKQLRGLIRIFVPPPSGEKPKEEASDAPSESDQES